MPEVYRIIALISTLSKKLKRIVQKWFMAFQDILLIPIPVGSCPWHSARDALILLLKKVKAAKKQNGFQTAILLIDMDGSLNNILWRQMD